ncbi:MAG: hypothetical protein FWH21_04510 [Kiritimatiellaeota bacterium]|nr:hypothetical protein [Kiritimatiellota bacterium]
MTVFAACAIAGAAVAADSNIVGYVNTDGNDGATLIAPMFIECGGSDTTLGMITGEFEEWADTLQILDDTLAMATIYFWADVGAGPVWTSDGATDDSTITIPRGAGVVVSKSTATIFCAGEVEMGSVVIPCGSGATALGNPTPVKIKLGDINFSDLEEWSDTLQLLDGSLAMATIYFWADVGSGPVWTSDGATDDSTVELAPGAGFVLSSMNGSTVTFPAAL